MKFIDAHNVNAAFVEAQNPVRRLHTLISALRGFVIFLLPIRVYLWAKCVDRFGKVCREWEQ